VIVSEPPPTESFDLYYRSLILGSARRSVSFESELQRAMGHRLRARRAERRALELRGILGESEPSLARAGAMGRKRVVGAAWLVTLVLLLGALSFFGIRSWPTGLADLVLIALTFAWFLLESGAEPDAHP